MATIQLDLPDEALTLPGQSEETLRVLAREALLVRLYAQGIVTADWAAQALGISRHEFLDLLRRYGVSEFDEQMDVHVERERAIAVLRAAGLLTTLSPEEQSRAAACTTTLDEVQEALSRGGGTPLSEIIIEQRGPKG